MVHEMLYNPGWQLADADLIGVWNFAKEAAVVEEPLKLLPALDMQELQVLALTSLRVGSERERGVFPTHSCIPGTHSVVAPSPHRGRDPKAPLTACASMWLWWLSKPFGTR